MNIKSIIYGFSSDELIPHERTFLNARAKTDFEILCSAANADGFEPAIVSGWRSFERQCIIWNEKATGQRPLLDSDGVEINRADLSDEQTMWAILRWSALPGGSRHHWGTDFDIIDRSALTDNYKVQLTVAETEDEGIFAPFHKWLTSYLSANKTFFRPYTQAFGGVAPEPWHISHAVTARQIQEQFSLQGLAQVIEASEVALKSNVLANIEKIYTHYSFVNWENYP